MRDRCLREKFACLSLAENVHKKNNFSTTSSFKKLGQINFGGVKILELATDTILGKYRCSYQYDERQMLKEKNLLVHH